MGSLRVGVSGKLLKCMSEWARGDGVSEDLR